MPILADLSRRLHLLTTDAKPDPPRDGVPSYTHNLPDPADRSQKSAPSTPGTGTSADDLGDRFTRRKSVPDPGDSSPLGNSGTSNGTKKNSKDTKVPRFKAKTAYRNGEY